MESSDHCLPFVLDYPTHFAAGKSVVQVADELSLSPKTISTYHTRLLEKLKLQTTADLIRYSILEEKKGDGLLRSARNDDAGKYNSGKTTIVSLRSSVILILFCHLKSIYLCKYKVQP